MDELDEPTYWCPECQDRLYVPGLPIYRGSMAYTTVKPCNGRQCPAWEKVRERCAEMKGEQDQRKGRVKKPDAPF